MISKLLKTIWIVSSYTPLVCMMLLTYYIKHKSLWVLMLAIGILTFGGTLFYLYDKLIQVKLADYKIELSGNIEKDNKIAYAMIMADFVPLASIKFEEYESIIMIIISILILVTILFSSTLNFNPWILIFRYNYYKVSIEKGPIYTVISKRELKKCKSLNVVKMLTENFMYDSEVRYV